jgi:hypothetical protein
MTFRKEFKELTPLLFDKLKLPAIANQSWTKVPVLFMTATCSKAVLDAITTITGLRFDTDVNIFWPPPMEMKHRHVFLEVQYSNSALSVFKKKVGPRLKESTIHKFILYSNTRASVLRVTPKLCDWIDSEGHKADLLKIVGTLLREQKFYHIRVFTRSNADHYDELEFATEDKRPFNPQILVATSGAANAGIDDP